MEVQVKPPMAVTNAVSWRVEGIKHKKNEVRRGLGAPRGVGERGPGPWMRWPQRGAEVRGVQRSAV